MFIESFILYFEYCLWFSLFLLKLAVEDARLLVLPKVWPVMLV